MYDQEIVERKFIAEVKVRNFVIMKLILLFRMIYIFAYREYFFWGLGEITFCYIFPDYKLVSNK